MTRVFDKIFVTIYNTSNGRIRNFESFRPFLILDFCGHIKILLQKKHSKFVRMIRYLETEDFSISNKHEIIVLSNHF